MYLNAIAAYLPVVEAFATTYGGRLETTVEKGASAFDIRLCERALAQDLPADFKNFLLECNGFKSTIYGPNGIEAFELEIFGTDRLPEEYRKMVSYVEEHADTIELDDAREFIVFSGPERNILRHLLHRTTGGGSFFEVVWCNYPNGDWLTVDWVIADSFQEFFMKSLNFMKQGHGFFYYEGVDSAEDLRNY